MMRPVVVKRSDLDPAEASAQGILRKQKERERRQVIDAQARADIMRAMCSLTDQEAQVYRRAAIEALMGVHVWTVRDAPRAPLLTELHRIFGSGEE